MGSRHSSRAGERYEGRVTFTIIDLYQWFVWQNPAALDPDHGWPSVEQRDDAYDLRRCKVDDRKDMHVRDVRND